LAQLVAAAGLLAAPERDHRRHPLGGADDDAGGLDAPQPPGVGAGQEHGAGAAPVGEPPVHPPPPPAAPGGGRVLAGVRGGGGAGGGVGGGPAVGGGAGGGGVGGRGPGGRGAGGRRVGGWGLGVGGFARNPQIGTPQSAIDTARSPSPAPPRTPAASGRGT